MKSKRSHKKLPYHEKVKRDAARRRDTIKRLRSKGKSFEEIGEQIGVTRQRAHQIYKDA